MDILQGWHVVKLKTQKAPQHLRQYQRGNTVYPSAATLVFKGTFILDPLFQNTH